MRVVACASIVLAGVGFAVISFSGPKRASPDRQVAHPAVEADLQKAQAALENAYGTKVKSKRGVEAPVECRHVMHQARFITWCGFQSGTGNLAEKGYWELKRVGDDVIAFALNGDALRALENFRGSQFQPGYDRPFLDLNALEAAHGG